MDTLAYIRGADARIAKVTGLQSQWTLSSVRNSLSSSKDRAVKSSSFVFVEEKNGFVLYKKAVLSGRSIYYGTFLYFGDLIGQFWASVLLQAVLVMLAIGLTLCEAFGFRWKNFTLVSVGARSNNTSGILYFMSYA